MSNKVLTENEHHMAGLTRIARVFANMRVIIIALIYKRIVYDQLFYCL